MILAFLLILFVWMMTLDLEPALTLLLTEPEKKEAPCAMKSGGIYTANEILYSSDKEGGLLWISHKSEAIEECRFLKPEEAKKRIPSGLLDALSVQVPNGFVKIDLGAFRLMEEAYCQIVKWAEEFGSLNIVSGYFNCADAPDENMEGTYVFVAVMDQNSYPPRSFSFVWKDEESDKPLSELLVPISEINRLTGYGIFEDLIINKGYETVEELQSILSLGYRGSIYEERLDLNNE